MPLDHYISQVHLKNFYSPTLNKKLMYAIRKSDLELFTPNARSVCRIEKGSTSPYLAKERIIEEFLKTIEPKYNTALQKLQNNNIDAECIYVIAGFIAYILTCSPAGMRLNSVFLEETLQDVYQILDSKKIFPIPAHEPGGIDLNELLKIENIKVGIDPKYPQALGINSILHQIDILGNSKWDILINPFKDTPFFTSDYPVAIETVKNSYVQDKIIPLSPSLAIKIKPIPLKPNHQGTLSFSNFCYSTRKLSRDKVVSINRHIVRSAETTVFFRDNHEWILNFVKRNSRFRIELITHRIPCEKGIYLFFRQEVVENN